MSPRVLLTGTVGVGMTTVATAVGDLLREREVASAVVEAATCVLEHWDV